MNSRRFIVPVIGDIIVLADYHTPIATFNEDECRFFSAENCLLYVPFCDDFGPINLAGIIKFVELLGAAIDARDGKRIVFRVENTPRTLTNSIFLLGAYMVLAMRLSPTDIWACFESISSECEMYRDATFSDADFRLTLVDCWSGLARARDLGWIDSYDIEEYSHYDNPLEGDLHIMVPEKLVAFRGPRRIPEMKLYEDEKGCRTFSPEFYVEIFSEMSISTVIRLNEEEYDASDFEAHGIRCIDLEFEDCTAPPTHVMLEFMYIVDREAGAVAVHCKAGLGRTGTLIALYMMRTYRFSAREAMAWLRIVRPGSVIGQQQHFLCRIEATGEADGGASSAQDRPGLCLATACAALQAATPATQAAAAVAEAALGAGRNGGAAGPVQQDQARQVAAALVSPERTARRALNALRLGQDT